MKLWIAVLTLALFVISGVLTADFASLPGNSEVSANEDIFFMDRLDAWIGGSASRAPTGRNRRMFAATSSQSASPLFWATADLGDRPVGPASGPWLRDAQLLNEVLLI